MKPVTRLTMKTQSDRQVRVVALSNLRAMCKHISGTCHQFYIARTTKNAIHVGYSNPDEYGNPDPIVAVLPAWKQYDGMVVAIDPLRFVGDKDGYGYQSFEQLWDCEHLSRQNPDSDDWRTAYHWIESKLPAHLLVTSTWDKDGCVQTWHCDGKDFKGWREAQEYAVEQFKAGLSDRALINAALNPKPQP